MTEYILQKNQLSFRCSKFLSMSADEGSEGAAADALIAVGQTPPQPKADKVPGFSTAVTGSSPLTRVLLPSVTVSAHFRNIQKLKIAIYVVQQPTAEEAAPAEAAPAAAPALAKTRKRQVELTCRSHRVSHFIVWSSRFQAPIFRP